MVRGAEWTRIVGYHRVAADPNPALAEWAVHPDDFAAQMAWLAEAGYKVSTCGDLMRQIRAGTLPERTIAVTFDDGYLDNVTIAAPIMAQHGFIATIYIVSGLIGATAEWDARYGGDMAPLADRDQIRALHDAGWEIGHHTITHAGLTRLDEEEIRHEVLDGHADLECALGIQVETFAYPFSMQDARIRNLMVDTPFTEIVAAGAEPVTAQSPREAVPRVFMLREHTLADLESMISTGRDLASSSEATQQQ